MTLTELIKSPFVGFLVGNTAGGTEGALASNDEGTKEGVSDSKGDEIAAGGVKVEGGGVLGALVGNAVGALVGNAVGASVGNAVGASVGNAVGASVRGSGMGDFTGLQGKSFATATGM